MNPIARVLGGLIPGSGAPDVRAKDAVAEILRLDPAKLAAFEAAYDAQVLSREPEDDVFHVNSRQAAEANHRVDADAAACEVDAETVDALVSRVVDELVARTSVYVYDGRGTESVARDDRALPEPNPVTREEILAVPEAVRPQLSGNLVHRDVDADSGTHLLSLYADSVNPRNSAKRRESAYNLFRQGLDILDLDALTYEIVDRNRASMGHWLPPLVEACRGQEFLKIPATHVAKVPLTLLQLTRLEYQSLTPTTLRVVDEWAHRAFDLDESREYFIKTGTYSSKFDFRNARVTGAKEVRELGEYLLYIHFQALQMASPLATPTIYGASTTTEWVVREFIRDKENNPTIYKGLPLHTEYRVFVDCDEDVVLGCAPYWEPRTMTRRFAHEDDADSPHQIHDYVIYKSHERVLMDRYENNKADVVAAVAQILPDLNLTGQWSVDVMQNGEDFWLIDMAPAEDSAYYDEYVPRELRRPTRQDWTPQLRNPERRD